MKRRPNQFKIPDIKAVRGLTRFLGKLHVPSCYSKIRVEEWDPNINATRWTDGEAYGWGLKESKDYVESKYDYYLPGQETEADRLRGANIIHLTKRTRQFMGMLQNLGIKSADPGLAVCKSFVTRQRY